MLQETMAISRIIDTIALRKNDLKSLREEFMSAADCPTLARMYGPGGFGFSLGHAL